MALGFTALMYVLRNGTVPLQQRVNSQTANDVFAMGQNEQGYRLGTDQARFYQTKTETRASAALHQQHRTWYLEDNRGKSLVSTNQGLMRSTPRTDQVTYNNGNGLAVTEFSDGAFTKTMPGTFLEV